MSPRRLAGWEPRTATVHEYDDAGLLVRSVTHSESEWDDDDRAVMRALWLIEADECPGCRGPLSETADPANEDAYTAVATRCYRCTAVALHQSRFEGPQPTAVLWHGVKRGYDFVRSVHATRSAKPSMTSAAMTPNPGDCAQVASVRTATATST